MQRDFHYCAIYTLAVEAGYGEPDAAVIAYASQYVDDATEGEPVALSDGQIFDAVRTAHTGLFAFDWGVQKKIFMPFHFLPNGVRRENRRRFSYVTRPAKMMSDDLAWRLYDQAAAERDLRFRLVRLGVALHAIADTFAHSGFSGRQGLENDVEEIETRDAEGKWVRHGWQSLTDVFRPRIGHAEALDYPDEPWRVWRYRNGMGRRKVRNNVKSFRSASALLLAALRLSRGLTVDRALACPETVARLLLTEGAEDERCREWYRVLPNMPVYDPSAWRKVALRGNLLWDSAPRHRQARMLAKVTSRPGFETSWWALFHRAAFLQRALVWQWIN